MSSALKDRVGDERTVLPAFDVEQNAGNEQDGQNIQTVIPRSRSCNSIPQEPVPPEPLPTVDDASNELAAAVSESSATPERSGLRDGPQRSTASHNRPLVTICSSNVITGTKNGLLRVRATMLKYSKFVGPGFMVSVAYIDPGKQIVSLRASVPENFFAYFLTDDRKLCHRHLCRCFLQVQTAFHGPSLKCVCYISTVSLR